jgi:hypothetical protein
VSTSAVVFLGFRVSRKGPTERYPYGQERAEDLAGIGIAVVIWASAAFAGYESVRKLIGHGATSHIGLGIAGAALGIAGNQVVARYKLITGKRINSATLIADARHSRTDRQRRRCTRPAGRPGGRPAGARRRQFHLDRPGRPGLTRPGQVSACRAGPGPPPEPGGDRPGHGAGRFRGPRTWPTSSTPGVARKMLSA